MGRPRLRGSPGGPPPGAPLILGTVPHLNTLPLTLALEDREEVELRPHPPAELARLLRAGELDGALVSSFAMFHLPGARYVPGVGVTSRGPVESIRLYCRRPADALRRVGLDRVSLAASNMTRVYLKRRWGIRPEFVPIDPERPPREDPAIDAFLLIGDNALREPPGEHYVLDLGEEWTALTGLPFVYALWLFRPGAGDAAAAGLLREAKEAGVARLEEILEGAGRGYPHLDPALARRYLTECIRYDVGPEEEAGLGRFYELLVEDGLAPPGWRPERLPLEEAPRAGGDFGGGGAEEALCFLPLAELSGRIRRREVSPVEAAEAHLRRTEALDPGLCAFLTVTAERALEEARAAEAEIARGGWRGPLHGMPFGAKDIIETAGVRTTNGSSLFRDHVPSGDAACVARLKGAGAILLGKCMTHEFAAAATGVNPHYGTTRNPWDPARIAGGSSGGSAAAVAAGLVPFALGSDTGGSIRQPAALCGAVGLKPTHGRVSLAGVFPNAPTFDHLGPLARTARGAALVLTALAGYDPADPASRAAPVEDFAGGIGAGVRGLRIAVCPDLWRSAEADAEAEAAFRRAAEVLRGLGAAVEEAAFPGMERFERAFRPLLGAEFAEVHRALYERDPAAYGADVRERVERSLEVKPAEYVQALGERELLRREMAAFFGKWDAALTPGMPCAAAPIETLRALVNGREEDAAWIHRPFLAPHNLTGCPAVVVPMGFTGAGLPLALQIVGPEWGEAVILRIAHAYEEATPELRGRRPPIA